MASRYWIKNVSGSPGNWNDTANWSATDGGGGGSSVPGPSDDAYFTTNGKSGCTINATINILSLTCTSGYTGAGVNDGHFNNSGNYSVTVGGNVTLDHKSTTLGSGIWTIAGHFDYKDITGSFVDSAGTVVMTGTSKNLIPKATTDYNLYNLTISGSIILPTTNLYVTHYFTITGTGTFSVSSGRTLYLVATIADLRIASGGLLTGAGSVYHDERCGITQMDGTINVAIFYFNRDHGGIYLNIVPAQYDMGTVYIQGHWYNPSSSFWNPNAAGTYIFTGDVVFQTTGGDFVIDNSDYNNSYEFRGSVTCDISAGGTLTWVKGTGTIKISGTGSKNIDFTAAAALSIEDIEFNHTGTLRTVTGGYASAKTTLTAGNVTFNIAIDTEELAGTPAANITVKFLAGGNFVIDEFTLIPASGYLVTLQSTSNGTQWNVVATTDAPSLYRLAVQDSNLSGATNTVTEGTDLGNNSSYWVFGVVVGYRVKPIMSEFRVKPVVSPYRVKPVIS